MTFESNKRRGAPAGGPQSGAGRGLRLACAALAAASAAAALRLAWAPSFGTAVALGALTATLAAFASGLRYAATGNRMYRRAAYGLGSAVAAFALTLASLSAIIAGEFHARDGESEPVDYVVVLGAGLHGKELSQSLKRRLDTALDYARRHPDVPVVLSGGQGPDELVPEAEAMAGYLRSNGIDGGRLLLEDRSRTTEENIAFSKRLMKRDGTRDIRMLIVTADYHLYRAKLLAREPGYAVLGLASRSPLAVRANYTVRECFAVARAYALAVIGGADG
ncbi:YdcF family protein [Paenibacillus flagellatus]|uniref:DUF218 domain-containing protein n=1 Tax=Paenibacillus flagellatus TaxID=2211139 RepID=A0A2V5K2N7_9BACL|nr:YdcF family protein [Paenibacillus flagellatus]PYI53555.1 hypothetical protein DLM86_17495 [Paenibacillus flagellatus]